MGVKPKFSKDPLVATYRDEHTTQDVYRFGDSAVVYRKEGYTKPDTASVIVENTGNGYIARFPASNCTEQDYYVCMDYSQMYDLIIAMSAFKKDLGFRE
jgi:hypothetical protein